MTTLPTVIEYVLGRLKAIGVTDIFGVPGDFAFPVQDAIVAHPDINWIGCCNELNAAYAADGYARIRGVAAVSTTYGVGELSAISAIAGSYAEHLPVFHLTGMPKLAAQSEGALVHHTLGNGEFGLFRSMADKVVGASAILTPANAVAETERLIFEALYNRRPVYMAFPSDVVNEPVLDAAVLERPVSEPETLATVVDVVASMLESAASGCVLPGMLLDGMGLQDTARTLVENAGLPFATMFADKSVLGEHHPNYVGMYDGRLMNEPVREFVESCDVVMIIGTMLTDFNSGAFTASLDPERTINIGLHSAKVGSTVYRNVEMADVLRGIAERVTTRDRVPADLRPTTPAPIVDSGEDPLTADALYPRWVNFLEDGDIVVAETGTCSMGLAFAQLPEGASFHNQTLWGAIGWATPAAFGAAVAAPDRRLVLFTGEGSHQLTAQEICQFHRLGLRPIIFVLNNSGYLIERLLCKDPAIAYNDVAPWNYAELPHALGCDDWFTARVTTGDELDAAMKVAASGQEAAYIEVVTDVYAAPLLPQKLHENVETLYHLG